MDSKQMAVRDEVEFCRILIKTNALKFGVFKLTSGKLSPYYVDLRSIPSYPEAFKKIMGFYGVLVKEEVGLDNFDRISCVPTSGLLFAAVLAFQHSKPILYVRREAKTHGRERRIEGVLTPGDRVILVDDLITTGKSLVDVTQVVRGEGGIVTDAIVLLDREEGGRGNLERIGVKLHSFMRISEVANRLFNLGVIDESKYRDIIEQCIRG
ncbi:orotate phosphoribosyltransferase [Candidatus Bathyarchaeota archaeon]|nr:orotate phosphoribosyltransferase [Candidatus Bathyarchaeota archaeon]MBS7629010.1 orotate phosphoribosyltransferase [Candidatus Bathyarchaeota archaeon]